MRPDYGNWVPQKLVLALFAGCGLFLCLALLSVSLKPPGVLRTALPVLFASASLGLGLAGVWMLLLNRIFSYDGKWQVSRRIVDAVSSYVEIPEGGRALEVGCGSAALAIAVAKANLNSEIVATDVWSGVYKGVFSKDLCERNAHLEGVMNIVFEMADARALQFEDESFDAVFSNYVYHNISSRDRQAILLETLRTLKKGGTFAIHDIFSRAKYKDMSSFLEKLKHMGYQSAELVSTSEGNPIGRRQAKWMGLSHSAILYGRK